MVRLFAFAFLGGLLLSAARADEDCFDAAQTYIDMCPKGRIENGLEYLPSCNLGKAKANFLWASRNDPGAVKTFRTVFDHCSTRIDWAPKIVVKNYFSAILAQTHDMDALCSIAACFNTGELTGYLEYENIAGHLYTGNSPKEPTTPSPQGLTDGCNCPTCAFTCSVQRR
jgi:hypothetical protein